MKTWLLFLSLFAAVQTVTYFCSSYCKAYNCNGWTANSCNNCNTGWFKTGSTCQPNNSPLRAEAAVSNDITPSGSLDISPSGGASECKNLPSGASIKTYGSYKASNIITATVMGGTTLPHYGLEFIYSVILVDTDGTRKWDSNAKITTNLDLPVTTQAPNSSLNNGGSSSVKSYCGDTGMKDAHTLIQQSYVHNELGTDISFSLKMTNPDSTAVWVAREFILLVKTCHLYCLICTGPAANQCSQCDSAGPYWLTNTTCATSCPSGYGPNLTLTYCVLCNSTCVSCYGQGDNCSSCKAGAPWSSFLYFNATLNYNTCVAICPAPTFANTTSRTCDPCNTNCATCMTTATRCLTCPIGFGWAGFVCYQPCPIGYFSDNGGLNCTRCNLTCIDCTSIPVCLSCTLNGTNIAYFLNSSCLTNCPVGYYPDTNNLLGPNMCLACFNTCATCTGNPGPCLSCNNGSYLYNSSCGATCPVGWVAMASINQCQDCQVSCVRLQINMYFPSAYSETIFVDMTFSRDLNMATFDYANFQTIEVSNYPLSAFTLTYTVIDSKTYRIQIKPNGFAFIYNETVKVKTIPQPATLHMSSDLYPFHVSTYSKQASLNWFLLKTPDITAIEKQVINGLDKFSAVLVKTTTHPLVAQFKKAGFLAMLFSGAQITSCSVFINNIPPQNMYEGVRIWAIFVFWDVPAWERNSQVPNKVIMPDVYDMVKQQRLLEQKNQRHLFDMTTIPWRFHRTGQSSFFLFDVYMPIALIVFSWLLLGISRCLKQKSRKWLEPKCFTILHKVHQAAILYITMGMVLEWMYFDGASTLRWVSLGVSIFMAIYLTVYHLYIYYDLLNYPKAGVESQPYFHYVKCYSCFLSNLRYQQYDSTEEWSPKHWLRPYNYHILGYIKKFCMIICLPLFYNAKHAQAATLIILQIVELIRYSATRPYHQNWRHCIRLLLEISLLLFFIDLLIEGFVFEEVQKNDPETILLWIKIFTILGWSGFALVFFFNGTWVILMLIDFVRGFKMTTLQQVQQGRRVFYYGSMLSYERQNEQAPLGLINHWVKSGNLNRRNRDELPDINLRVEQYRIQRKNGYYLVGISAIGSIEMNDDINYDKENNTTTGRQIKKLVRLTPQLSPNIHAIAVRLYSRHARIETEAITLKTFIRIKQRNYVAGQKIPMDQKLMFQRLQLENVIGEITKIKLPRLMEGFPINQQELNLL